MKLIFTILLSLISCFGFSQTTEYSHCKSTETLTETSYKVISNGIELENGYFNNNERVGEWISKNNKGTIIRKANYSNGKLDGDYTLFHYNGKPKLTASFKNELPVGRWKYYNSKGKVIKEGSYENGKPVGVWKIYNKKGKKVYAEYNFDTNSEIIAPLNKRYFKGNGVIRDDQSGEWIISYFVERTPNTKTIPFGEYFLIGDIFSDYFIVPTVFINTHAKHTFDTYLHFNDGIITLEGVKISESASDTNNHFLPFIVDTNPPSKLSNVEHSQASLEFLKDQLAEFILIAGPWISSEKDENMVIRTPIVINNLNK